MDQSNEDINGGEVFSPTLEDDNQDTFLGSEKSSKKKPENLSPNVLKGAWETNLEVRPERDWEELRGRAVSHKRERD